MAGHSLEGAVALGVWTRLRAQALYFEDHRGVPLVLVVGDLWAVEPGLVDRVTERLAEHPGLDHIGREHVVIAATHTHHGPGLFSSDRIYSAFAAPEGGHDPDLFEALASRLSTAIAEAAAARRPARLTRHTVAVPALARNRSVSAFLRDPEASDVLSASAGLPGCPDLPAEWGAVPGVDSCHAVDPVLETLVVTEEDSERTIALAGFFAMHPTAMPNKTELYHGDVFGLATARAEARLGPGDGPPPVVALFNGAEGDVSPHWDPQGRPSTAALGQALSEALVSATGQPGRPVEGTIEVAFGWRALAGVRWTDDAGEERRTARRPQAGKGQFGGAEDGRTRMYDRGWNEGVARRRARRGGQGSKRPALPWPLSAAAPARNATPRRVPLSVVQLGDVPLVTLPGEVTTVLGRRISTAVSAELPGEPSVLRIGLANAYLSYFTTPEEYALQHYEGASMLYGEQTGMLLRHHLAQLAAAGTVERTEDYAHRPGHAVRWELDRSRLQALPEIEQRLAVQLDTGPIDGMPRFHWWDHAPRWPTTDPRARLSPRIRVEAWHPETGWGPHAPDGIPTDDRSGALVSMLTHVRDSRWRWGAWWIEPGASLHQPLRFLVERVGGGSTCSEAFSTRQWLRADGPGWLREIDCATAPRLDADGPSVPVQ